jgi:Putative Flp pilus-assembly TadE/G-like
MSWISSRIGAGSRNPSAWRRLENFAKTLWGDTQGLVLPYVTMMLVVIVGISVLALDGARYMSLQTQLQNGADALALAGAAELDRLPDAQVRAVRAITNLLTNATLFGNDASRRVQVSRVEFYARLPADDSRPMSEGALATDGTNARFVSVTVRPVALNTILPASFFQGANAIAAGAAAVAGFDQVVCQVTPMYICNPYEAPGMSYDQASGALQNAVADPAIRRRLIRLRQYGDRNEPQAAGDYGFLDLPTAAPGPGALIDALANARPGACFVQNGVNFRSGTMMAAREAFNVRFDIYEAAMGGRENDPDYRPSLNVRKGYVGGGGGACNARPGTAWPIGAPPGQVTGLPLDREWPFLDGRMGNGNWNFATYWQVNHGADGRSPPTVNGAPASNSNLPSRYEVYRYEIDEGFVSDRSLGGESGTPACYRGGALPDVPDRRVLQAAIINCQSLGLVGGAQSNVPVAAFGKLFLTLPLQRSQSDLYVEIIGLMKPDDSGNFDMVQLYR